MKLSGILFSLLFFAFCCKAQQAKDVFISGKLLNLNNRTSILDLSEMGALRPNNNDREIAPDSAGNFSVHFKLAAANYFMLAHNIVYLSPGDQIKVIMDFNNPEKSTFFGSGSVENYYLESVDLSHSGSFLAKGFNLKGTIKERVELVLQLAAERRNKLHALNNPAPEFVKLEDARIDADIINSFKRLPGFFTWKNNIPRKDEARYFKEADSLTRPYLYKYASKLRNADFLKIEVVRDNFYRIMDSLKDTDPDAPVIRDWQYAYETVYYINESKNKEDLLKLKPRIDSIKNKGYRNAVKESFELKAGFWNGDPAINFRAYDINNKNVSLESFKGKIIYIDLWATWCGPCLQELPQLDSLRKQYANNSNIVFVSLCVNERVDDWKKDIQKRNQQGIQLFADRNQMLPYKIYSIPRTIIVDKDFKVLMMNGPTPSNPGLKAYLNALLERKPVN